jgi:hypothetical protein
MFASIRARAKGHNVIGAAVMVLLLALVLQLVLAPGYRAVSAGFDPFDDQYPLTREMVAIQRGAFLPGVEMAYGRYAVVAAVFAMAKAVAFALLWAWLIARMPSRWLARLDHYGLLLLPYLAALSSMIASVVFSLLVVSDPIDPQFELTAVALDLHRLAIVMARIVLGVTAALIVIAVMAIGLNAFGHVAARDKPPPKEIP